MRIAIVGSGISGLIAAYLLNSTHDITVFESASWIGGHTHTIPVNVEEHTQWVDTGFIVFNDRNYPNLNKLFSELGLETQESNMSFSVSCEKTGLIYQGSSLNGLFAQRKNIFNPDFYKFFYEIHKFKKLSLSYLSKTPMDDEILKTFLDKHQLSDFFVEKYLMPMLSAIWSNPQNSLLDTPVIFIMRFLNNHGMLSIQGRPVWKTLVGGSHTYVNKMTIPFRSKIILETQVSKITESKNGAIVHLNGKQGQTERRFDRVIVAVHSDQAMALLDKPSDLIKNTVGEILYQINEVILHQDSRCLPKIARAHASWNCFIPKIRPEKPVVTYSMNLLQNIQSKQPLLVSLNANDYIDNRKVIQRFFYAHPIFNHRVLDIQKQFFDVNTVDSKVFFCGAYWGNGFHEDGLNSGIKVAQLLGGEWS